MKIYNYIFQRLKVNNLPHPLSGQSDLSHWILWPSAIKSSPIKHAYIEENMIRAQYVEYFSSSTNQIYVLFYHPHHSSIFIGSLNIHELISTFRILHYFLLNPFSRFKGKCFFSHWFLKARVKWVNLESCLMWNFEIF